MVAPPRTSWRMAAWPHELLVMRGHDVQPDERGRALEGPVAARKVEAWLRDPATRERLVGLCREVTGSHDTVRVAQRLQEAFEWGALVALRLESAREPEGQGIVPREDLAHRKETSASALTWIEIELVDSDGRPVSGERYRITLPDGSVYERSLDARGFARVDGIDPGTCKVTFPNLHKSSWKTA